MIIRMMHAARSKQAALVFSFVALLVLAMPVPAQAGFKFVPDNGGAAPGFGMPAAPTASPVVEGFGDRVPLPVALRQILPRGTVYNIAPDVDMGVQVSWTGGRAWQQVLTEMLGAVGLQGHINGNTVNVKRAAYMNGNITGTSEPIQLMPPVRLTPPLEPVVIEDTAPVLRQPAARNEVTSLNVDAAPMPQQPAHAQMALAPLDAPMPVEPAPVQTSPSRDLMPTTAAPVTTAGSVEVTSHDPEFKNGQPLASSSGYLTVPAGMQDDGAVVDVPDAATSMGAPSSNLLPLDGSAPLVDAAPATDPNLWEARSGQSLRDVLAAWCERANTELNWQSEYDYPVQASLTYTGTFDEAVRTLLFGFKDATPQPIGRLHRNTDAGQQTLLIATRGNIYEE